MSNNSEKKDTTPKGEKGGEKLYMIEFWDYDGNILDTYYPVPQDMIDKLQREMQKIIDESGPFDNEEEEVSMRREIIYDMDDFFVDIDIIGGGIYDNLKLYDIHLNDFYYE